MDETEKEPRERYKTLSNGAIYDMQTKRISANPGGGKYAITSENASEYHAKRQEKKRRAIEAGAMAAVNDKMPDAFTGDDGDWIEAVAQQVAYKALDRLDPKQVDAARFLLTEAGLGEAKQGQASPAEAVADILREVASIAASLSGAPSLDIITVIPNDDAGGGQAQGDGEGG